MRNTSNLNAKVGTKKIRLDTLSGEVDIQLKPLKPAVPGDVCTCPLTGAESVRSAPVIIINSSSGGSGADDANSGDEDNTRMRGNHRSS